MATTIWATPTGGSVPQDGSSYENAYTFANAVGRINAETISEDWFVNLVGTFTLTAKTQADPIASEGSQSGRVNWRGTDSSGNAATATFIASGAAYAFSASGVLRYHTFRNIDTALFQVGDHSGFDFRYGSVGCHGFRCRAVACRRGFDFGSEVQTESDVTLVQCGTVLGATSFYGSTSTDMDCIECTSTDAAASNFNVGGVAMRCISETSVPSSAFGFKDFGTVLECTSDGMNEAVRYTRPEMGYFVGLLAARTSDYAVHFVNADPSLSVSGALVRGVVNDGVTARVFAENDGLQYDFDSAGDMTADPFIDYLNGNFGLNGDSGGGQIARNSGGYFLNGVDNMTFQDAGAVQSPCLEAPTDAVFTGTVINRSIH